MLLNGKSGYSILSCYIAWYKFVITAWVVLLWNPLSLYLHALKKNTCWVNVHKRNTTDYSAMKIVQKNLKIAHIEFSLHHRTTFKGGTQISCQVSYFGVYLDHLACCSSIWCPHHRFLRITETGPDPLLHCLHLPHWYAEYARSARWDASKTVEWQSRGWGLQKPPEWAQGCLQKLPLGGNPYT